MNLSQFKSAFRRLSLSQLKSDFRLTSDGDDWGNCLHWWFTIADEIHFNRENLCVPESWRFKPSPCGPSNEADRWETTAVREADDDSLMQFGHLVNRYARLLKHLGKDY